MVEAGIFLGLRNCNDGCGELDARFGKRSAFCLPTVHRRRFRFGNHDLGKAVRTQRQHRDDDKNQNQDAT